MAGQADRVERPELAGRDHPARLRVAGVEPALEAELERARRCARSRRPPRSCRRGRRRAASRRRSAGRARWPPGSAGVGLGGRRDHDRLGVVEGGLDGRRDRRADVGGDLRRAESGRVRDDQPSTPGVAVRSRAWSRPIRPAPSSATLIGLALRSIAPDPAVGGPPRGRAGRSRRSPTAGPSRCPARPSASRRSRGPTGRR